MSQIVDFYKNKRPNSSGKYINEIWSFDNVDLERCHDYIQWLFPLDEGSAYNPDAPILTKEDIELFKTDRNFDDDFNLYDCLDTSLTLMLEFYGFNIVFVITNILIVFNENFNNRYSEWLYPGNHNYLRITRILKSLCLLGKEKEAKAFLDCLKILYKLYPDYIGEKTFGYWCAAVPE